MKHFSNPTTLAILLAGLAAPTLSHAADLTKNYQWRPVRIGAGGFVVGMVVHPLDPNIRYARTDVGEAYRWDAAAKEWFPMRVRFADGSGVPASAASAPSPGGEQSLAVDPFNTKIVYMAINSARSGDFPSSGVNIYKSVDGGRNWTGGDLDVPGNPNDDWRMFGERLAVDPHDSKTIYFGTPLRDSYAAKKAGNGLYRSGDGGAHWAAVAGVPSDANVVQVVIDPHGKGPSRIYAVIGDGDVCGSSDGGKTWANLTAGSALSGHAGMSAVDTTGALWTVQTNSRTVWKFAGGSWSSIAVDTGGAPLHCVAVTPKDPQIVWAVGENTGTAMSRDGGRTWTAFGPMRYANTLGWLPQTVGSAVWGDARSNGGIYFDSTGSLWIPMGQEGTLHYTPTGGETPANPPKFVIDSKGIEELVAQDVILPRGGKGRALVAVEDATGFVIPRPDDFSAVQIPLQKDYGLIAQGTSLAGCPNDPDYAAITCSNVYMNGPSLSGYTSDGGKTWRKFASTLQYPYQGKPYDLQAGFIAVGRRTAPKADGSDVHLVHLPLYSMAPVWSHDGGRTWHKTTSFPLGEGGFTLGSGYQGFWVLSLKQRPLYADPFTPDKFYLKFTHAPASFYVSTDGGETWQPQTKAGLPDNTHHGQLAVNPFVKNDLWYADGWEGASEHGVWRSTDGGATFSKLPDFAHAITLAVGARRGNPGDAPYTVYVYGQRTNDSGWGVFRSVTGGKTWDRISDYPCGIYDWPTCLAASPDVFGLVWVGFGGNSFVYGTPKAASAK